MKIIWIRHGMTKGNEEKRYIGKTDESLSEKGRKELLKKKYETPDRIFVSPKKRCVETAEILFPGQRVKNIENFRECDFGEFENKNYLELAENKSFQIWMETGILLKFPGGEWIEDFKNRCCLAFEQLVSSESWNTSSVIACVVHGGTIMSILEKYALPEKGYYEWQIKNGEAIITECRRRITSDKKECAKYILEPRTSL